MDDLLREFLTETSESITVLDVELIKLEQQPDNPELLGVIFRVVHTIKGTGGFLGLPRLEAVAHAAEEVLGKFRAGELTVTQDAVTLILESLDCIKGLLSALEQTEAEPAGDDKELIGRLDAFAKGGDAPSPAEEAACRPQAVADEPIPADLATHGEAEAAATETSDAVRALASPDPAPADVEQPAVAPAASPAAQSAGQPAVESAIASHTIRVGVDLLEHLMTMVSELVLTRNQLLQMVRGQSDNEFVGPLQQLSHVTTELQEGVMKTRMQPVGNAWAKLPRIIRDISVDLGKKIDLKMIGAETELDRQVLELIKDPLTHMVRNSGDHGIETPAERKAAGKPETGRLVLNAYHEGGHIIIEIRDDGRGIDVQKVKQKALQNGLVSESDLETMSDKQILQLIFRPGLSTAATVTNVSGRGVGMDVVKTNVEKIGGTIELDSIAGKGTTFVIKIPLTLAIVSALIVECRGVRFAIPQISVVELVRASANSKHTIEMINEAPVLRLRGRLLPLVSLSRILGMGDSEGVVASGSETFIVVSRVGAHSFGLIVDRVFDTEEIVVKPVSPMLRDISVYAGNTILGDGSIIMILDCNGIAAEATHTTIAGESQAEEALAREGGGDDTVAFLVFGAGGGAPKAVPLALVARLEGIDMGNVEYSDGQPVVQYRGQLMPLVCADPNKSLDSEGKTPVVVFTDRKRSMGLVVDEIIDIVEEKLDIELKASGAAVIGSAVIAGKATDVIDAGYYLTQAFGDWFRHNDGAEIGESHKSLLLVDDSPFFRNMLAPLLSAAGYDVTMAEGGDEALKLLDAGREFDIIVSDIDMPGMNGFDLAKACRSDERWRATPIVALTSHTSPEDCNRSREAGFTDYVAKFDRDALFAALSQSLSLVGDAA